MPGKQFAIPSKAPGSGSYPINDASHARNALSRVSQFGSPSEKAAVRAKVHAKYPNIGKARKAKFGGVFNASDSPQKPKQSRVRFGGSMACGGVVK